MNKLRNIYHSFMDSIYHLAYIKDEKRCYIAVNSSFLTFFDMAEDAVIGKTDDQIWGEENTAECSLSDEYVLKYKKGYEITEYVHGKYFKTSKFPIVMENGQIGIGAISEDVSESIQNKNRLSSYFNNAPEAILIVDENGKYIDVNPAACDLTGYEKAQLLQKSLYSLLPPHGDGAAKNSFSILKKEGKFEGEIRLRRKDGLIVDIELRAVQLDNGNYMGFCTDISSRKMIEKELFKDRERLELIQKSTKLGLWEWNLKTDEVLWDRHCYEMLGFEDRAFEVSYEKWASLLHSDDKDGAQNEVQEQLLKGNIFSITFRFQKRDKGWIWIEARGKVIERDENSMPLKMVGFHMDVSDVHKNQQILEERDRLLQKLSEQIPGVIYRYQRFADGKSCFPFASEHIWDIYEVTPDEVREDASIIFERIYPDDYDLVAGSILLSWERLTQWQCEYRVNLPSRGIRWLRGVANPQRQPDKSVIWHGYIADITEQKKIEKAFHKAREDAENAARAKSEFLANMSHEIRTPLNAIVGLGGLLEQDNLDKNQLSLVHKLNQSSQLLMGVLNDILDYSKIEAGKLELDNAPLSLTALMEQIYNIFSMSAFGKGISLEFAKDPDVPEFIYGDSLRLSQILTNLVSNAVKFTQEGRVSLHVSQTSIVDEYVNLSISVKDTGIGMSERMLENLFQPFTQEDSSTTRKYGGSGLGLSIANHLIETMGGSIKAQSKLGEGSTFTTLLRAKIASKDEIIEDNSIVASVGSFERFHILLVEDNPINQEVASLMCKRLGARVSVANNGQKAIDLYKDSPKSYNIILMDIQMPIMGGYEATQILRQMGCDLPIVALTAAATVEDKKKALEIGMNDHLSKPIDTHALVKVLAKWLGQKEAPVEVEKGENLSIFQEDEALYKKLLRDFYKAWNPLLESLVQELQSPNEGTQKTIHTLKGVSGNLNLQSLYELCVQIDTSFKKAQPITKNQAQKFKKIFTQTLKNIELSSAKNEQSQSKKSNLDEAKKLYNDLYEALRNYDMVSYDFQSVCKDAFNSFVDQDSLTKWESAMDALDYESAKALMESWDREGWQ